ncbi:MAG: hypothetical protein JSR19_12715 [Proteobacteria bacterium]|nr:hypothetical protein [Pseudomonadota bacterium]HQR04065.1 pilus assembly protein TadG-related protein [Rhodocyclaceae bacterium]
MPVSASRLRAQRGQAMVLALLTSLLMVLGLYAMYSTGTQAIEKIKLQNTADAAAYSAAVAEARDYNFSAYTNRAMVANQVAVAQFVGLTSWFRNMSAFANGDPTNIGRDIYQIFLELGSTPVANIYKRFLKVFGKITGIFDEGRGGSTFMSAAVTVLDGLIMVYGETQRIYHYATALTVAETLGAFTTFGNALDQLMGVSWFSGLSILDGGGSVIKANDSKAQLTAVMGLSSLAYHYYQWFKFTERKDPNTDNGDGANADRFAQVTLDSLDDFSRDRSTKPAWGFTFFYAPPLTYIDPTRFIPQPWTFGPLFMPVIHRGGTELKVLNDASPSGNGSGSGSNGSTGLDCHGNSVSPGASSGIQVDYWSDLSAYSASACEGDAGMVSKGDAGHPQGAYAYNGSTWINAATLQNTQGSAGGSTAPRSTGNRGAPGSKSKKTWTAIDASSWAGLHIFWFVIPVIFVPIPLPIPFAPPWIPLSHGAAQSGKALSSPVVLATDNNFGVDANAAYGGTMSSWTTKLSASMRQPKGAGASLDKISSLGGLTPYMDVAQLKDGNGNAISNLQGPPLVVEIEKSTDDMAQAPGTGQVALINGAPHNKMRVLSKAQVVFSRPTNDPGLSWFARASSNPQQTELGSLYNPYWQPRLAPNQFLEQYLSMEFQQVGM